MSSLLTLSRPSTTKVPYANSLDPDEMPSSSKLFDTQTTFAPSLSFIGRLVKFDQGIKGIPYLYLLIYSLFIHS